MAPQGPAGGPGMPPRQVRQGTSRMVPVVVSAGLAIGVFCGLLFGLGTGKISAAPAPSAGNGVKPADDPAVDPESINTPHHDKASAAAGSAAVAATGSGSAAQGSAAPIADPAADQTKLVVKIKPEAAARVATVFVDGKQLADTTTSLAIPRGSKQKVRVVVKAPGYNDVEQDVEVDGETSVDLELTRASRPTASASGNTGTGNAGGNTGTGNAGGNAGNGNAGGAGKSGGTGKGSGAKTGKGKGSGIIDI